MGTLSESLQTQTEKLLDTVDNRFILAVGVARRGRQLVDGANSLLPGGSSQFPVATALAEIQAGKVVITPDLRPEEDGRKG
jgi:DNA-directed RNA polymerase omega subunit